MPKHRRPRRGWRRLVTHLAPAGERPGRARLITTRGDLLQVLTLVEVKPARGTAEDAGVLRYRVAEEVEIGIGRRLVVDRLPGGRWTVPFEVQGLRGRPGMLMYDLNGGRHRGVAA